MLLIVFLVSLAVGADVTTVHIIPHTHDDVGWLKTVDEYYLGANNSIQRAGVQYILDTVISELVNDPTKTFVYVEVAFFSRWWAEQNQQMRNTVRQLVKEGRFEFINGGWCMNDEAGVSDEAIITQMTRGHMFLKENFDVTPRVGWQVDPFGHSNTMMSLFSQMGFSSVFFARMDYQDYENRKQNKELEYVWRPSNSLGGESDIFAHMMWGETYCYPDSFDFEGGDAPVNDDPNLENVNLQQRADEFVAGVRDRLPFYRPSATDIFVAYGCDFAFQNARINFKNMDKLVSYINNNSAAYGMQLKYSTPSRYVEAVNKLGLTWSLKTDDIFPYADRPYAYWTGYFTSRPALKGYVRSRNAFMRAADKFISVFGAAVSSSLDALISVSDVLRRAFSVSQHHDAVAGTEKQHVAYDYAKLLANGTAAVESSLNQVFNGITGLNGGWQYCDLLNETICPPLTGPLGKGQSVPVVLYNGLAWDRLEPVTLPLPFMSGSVSGKTAQISTDPFSKQPTITFLANISAMGWTSYSVSPKTSSASVLSRRSLGNTIANEFYNITFGGPGGALSSINGQPFAMNFLWYNESAGNNVNSTQPSGAYIFRPNSTTPYPTNLNGNLNLQIEVGPVFQAAVLTYNSWVSTVVRVYRGLPFIEIVSKIGPIDISDGMGKEVIHRFDTPIQSGSSWYTDSSWEEMQLRVRNYRPTWTLNVTNPVAGNYYPMNQAAFLVDGKQQVTFLTDRSRGCASLNNGQFESMLHRRLLFDDYRGVGEPLNESEAIITTQNVIFGSPSPAFRIRGLQLNHPLQIVFGPAGTAVTKNGTAGLLSPFPSNVHLMDFFMMDDDTALVRLRHVYAKGEGMPYTSHVTLDLQDYLPRKIDHMEETQLTAVQPTSFVSDRLHWRVHGSTRAVKERTSLKSSTKQSFSIGLSTMEIRTFIVHFSPAKK